VGLTVPTRAAVTSANEGPDRPAFPAWMVALLVSTETISWVSSEAIVDWKRVSSPGMGVRAY
jgi:hypothetical protein